MKFHTLQNNITEMRTDALKLLAMFKRPVPRAATTIGAWLNIFQVLKSLDVKTILSCTLLEEKHLHLFYIQSTQKAQTGWV